MSEQEQALMRQIETARYSVLTLLEAYKCASPSVNKAEIKQRINEAMVDLNRGVTEFLAS